MKRSLSIMLVCLFALGLATAACDNPLSDAIDDLENLYDCDTDALDGCSDDLIDCANLIDYEGDSADIELAEAACEADYCDCVADADCEEWVTDGSCD